MSEDACLVARILNRHGARYVLVGGYALAAHGYVRVMEDVDIAVAPGGESARRWVAALAELPDGAASSLRAERDPFAGNHRAVIRINDEFTVDVLSAPSRRPVGRWPGAGSTSRWAGGWFGSAGFDGDASAGRGVRGLLGPASLPSRGSPPSEAGVSVEGACPRRDSFPFPPFPAIGGFRFRSSRPTAPPPTCGSVSDPDRSLRGSVPRARFTGPPPARPGAKHN